MYMRNSPITAISVAVFQEIQFRLMKIHPIIKNMLIFYVNCYQQNHSPPLGGNMYTFSYSSLYLFVCVCTILIRRVYSCRRECE